MAAAVLSTKRYMLGNHVLGEIRQLRYQLLWENLLRKHASAERHELLRERVGEK